MASILKVDALQGITAAGDITVTSEGGAATQSLQQGLAKAWVNFDFASTTERDALNLSSITDNGTADMTLTLSNAMGNANYATTGMSGEISGTGNPDGVIQCARNGGYSGAFTTTTARLRCTNLAGSPVERGFGAVTMMGDLA